VWETPTKPGRPAAGLDYIRYAAKSGDARPWFAIGGINAGNLPQVLEAGASRIVVVRAVTEAADAATAVRRLTDALSGARS
jgi:thiamine-phosphate pyrophosphorylase